MFVFKILLLLSVIQSVAPFRTYSKRKCHQCDKNGDLVEMDEDTIKEHCEKHGIPSESVERGLLMCLRCLQAYLNDPLQFVVPLRHDWIRLSNGHRYHLERTAVIMPYGPGNLPSYYAAMVSLFVSCFDQLFGLYVPMLY